MFKTRLITSIAGIPLIILVVWSPLEWVFTLFISLVAILAIHEYLTIITIRSLVPLYAGGILLTILLVILPHCSYKFSLPVLIVAGGIILLVIAFTQRKKSPPLYSWGWAMLGVLYIGWFLSLLVAMRIFPGTLDYPETGSNLVFLTFFATFGNDTMAYLIGRSFGRHRMTPKISPKKTWEGALGGLLGTIIVVLIFTLSTPVQVPIPVWHGIILGIFISVFAQLGDFAESALKRWAGVKDSGKLLPGHGGILDRFDSIFLASFVVYMYFLIFIL